MTPHRDGGCDVCGKPAKIHLTEICDGVKTSRSLCVEHAPAEMRDKMPFGPHRTPAEEVAFLRETMTTIDQQVSDPGRRAEFKAELEELIADIEAGRRRLGDD
jgi:hypothetical protein